MQSYEWEDPSSYERNGFRLIKNVYSQQEIEAMKEELLKIWIQNVTEGKIVQKPTQPGESLFPPMRNIHLEYPSMRSIVLDKRVFTTAKAVLGEEALIVGCTCFFKPPGSRLLPMHQDNYDIGASPRTSCATWISLDHAKPLNGALSFVPGTHRLDFLRPRNPRNLSVYGQAVPVPDGYSIVHIETMPGDVVVFSGNVLHGSNANTTEDQFRRAIAIHYVGISTEKIFVQHQQLMNEHGVLESRAFHKSHFNRRLTVGQ